MEQYLCAGQNNDARGIAYFTTVGGPVLFKLLSAMQSRDCGKVPLPK